jgi:hypothetical protein
MKCQYLWSQMMVWGKRRFGFADYSPYFDRLEVLLMANPTIYQQFIMVSTNTDDVNVSDYYVGVPNPTLMVAFDGFEPVDETKMPKVIDTLHIGDTSEIKRRFQFRHELRREA